MKKEDTQKGFEDTINFKFPTKKINIAATIYLRCKKQPNFLKGKL